MGLAGGLRRSLGEPLQGEHPLLHAFDLYEWPLMSFVTGARMVLTARFGAGEALRLIESERCTVTHGFDTHFHDYH